MRVPLKQALREHLEGERLSAAQLQSLQRMANTDAQPAPQGVGSDAAPHVVGSGKPRLENGGSGAPCGRSSRGGIDIRLRRWHWVVAAMLVLSAGLLVSVALRHARFDSAPQRIAEEVVRNHLKRRPLDVEATSVGEARQSFNKLDFALVESRGMSEASDFLGGRYCSLLGVPAAQLRVRNQGTGFIDTVYQIPYDPSLFGLLPNEEEAEIPLITYARGVEVSIWVEKAIVFARTHDHP